MSVATRPAPRATATGAPSTLASVLAIVRRGLRDHRRAPLTWGGSLGAMCALMAAIWPSIEGSINKAIQSYPQALKDAFNISRLTTVEQYIDAEMLSLIVPLAVAFLAVRVVTRALATAEEQRYLDTVLSTPVARKALAAGSFVVAAFVVAAVLAVMTLVTWIAGVLAGTDLSLVVLARGTANVWPLAMLFAGLATLAAGDVRGSTAVTAIATATLAAMYVIDLVGKVADGLEPLRWASAFRYYGSAIQDGIDPLAFAGVTVVAVGLAAAGALLFERRDVLA
jgi:ABC-2 type transport system permease protein